MTLIGHYSPSHYYFFLGLTGSYLYLLVYRVFMTTEPNRCNRANSGARVITLNPKTADVRLGK